MRINLRTIPSVSSISLAKIAIYGLLLIGLYHSALAYMITQWDKAEYNYCYLIPFVVLYLIYDKRTQLARLPSVPSWKGMTLLGFGLAFFGLENWGASI
jgi:hypothetical protein